MFCESIAVNSNSLTLRVTVNFAGASVGNDHGSRMITGPTRRGGTSPKVIDVLRVHCRQFEFFDPFRVTVDFADASVGVAHGY